MDVHRHAGKFVSNLGLPQCCNFFGIQGYTRNTSSSEKASVSGSGLREASITAPTLTVAQLSWERPWQL